MFLSTKILTKLTKESYKSRLKVGYIDDGLTIIGTTWAIWLDSDHIPNKVKALVVELAGGLPEDGKMFEISREKPEPQYVMVDEITLNIFGKMDSADKKLVKSPIMLTQNSEIRLFQTNDSKEIVEIKQILVDMVDKSEIDINIEGEPTGPCYMNEPYGLIYWYNSICKLAVLPMKKRDNLLFEILSTIDFNEKILAED